MTTTNPLLDGFLTGEDEHKPDYTTLNNVLEKVKDNYTDASMDGLMRDLSGGKIMSIKEVIDDIEELITVREDLKKEVFGDIDKATKQF